MKLTFLSCEPVPDIAELSRRMQRVAELGYSGIELTALYPMHDMVEGIVRLTEKFQLPVVSLLTGWSYSHEGLCLSSPEPEVRERTVQRLEDYVAMAARLGSIVVVGLLQGLRTNEPDAGVAASRITECLRRVADSADKRGVTVVVEPVNHLQVGFHHTADDAAELVRRVGCPALSYMLDTIHMNIEERSLFETIRTHGQRIRHFHLCESNGGPLGSGNLDIPGILEALTAVGYDHCISVKIYQQLRWDEAARQAVEYLGWRI